MKNIFVLIALFILTCSNAGQSERRSYGIDWKKVRILVYTKNGKGYVHANIQPAVKALREMSAKYGFAMDLSDDPSTFTDDNLKKYSVLVFNNTNNDVFDTDAQKVALMHYIQAGGGFVGLHSATGTERNWPWFKRMIGALFWRHAKHQPFTETIIDTSHSSMKGLPRRWEQDDECYFFKEVNPDLHVLMAHDLTTLMDDKDKTEFYGMSSPTAWSHEFDGGREWYTALGHDSATYFKPIFQQHLLGGIAWAAGQPGKKLDYRKARATSPNDPLPY